jgi:hypothetical protein
MPSRRRREVGGLSCDRLGVSVDFGRSEDAAALGGVQGAVGPRLASADAWVTAALGRVLERPATLRAQARL